MDQKLRQKLLNYYFYLWHFKKERFYYEIVDYNFQIRCIKCGILATNSQDMLDHLKKEHNIDAYVYRKYHDDIDIFIVDKKYNERMALVNYQRREDSDLSRFNSEKDIINYFFPEGLPNFDPIKTFQV